jgi:hypothetical protein
MKRNPPASSAGEKLQVNPPYASLDLALIYLADLGYQTPSQEDVKQSIQLAFQEDLDHISITITPNEL